MPLSKVLGSRNTQEFLMNLLQLILVIFITAFIVRFLWNRALVPHVTILKPVKTLLDALLLSIGLNLLM